MKPAVKTFLIIAVTASVTFSGTSVLYTIAGSNGFVTDNKELINKLNTVTTYLDKNYLYDDYDKQSLSDAAVTAYVEALDEPYTHYYPADEFKSYLSNIEESYVGIGVVISADEE